MKTHLATKDADNVLRLLRQLLPRERLRVLAEILPELEDDLPDTPASVAFWQSPDIETLVEQQGTQPIVNFASLLGGWPEDEPIDDFLIALNDWRQESLDRVSD